MVLGCDCDPVNQRAGVAPETEERRRSRPRRRGGAGRRSRMEGARCRGAGGARATGRGEDARHGFLVAFLGFS